MGTKLEMFKLFAQYGPENASQAFTALEKGEATQDQQQFIWRMMNVTGAMSDLTKVLHDD